MGLINALRAFTMLPGDKARMENEYNLQNEQEAFKQNLAEQMYEAKIRALGNEELRRQEELNNMGEREDLKQLRLAYPNENAETLRARALGGKIKSAGMTEEQSQLKTQAVMDELNGRLPFSKDIGAATGARDLQEARTGQKKSALDQMLAETDMIWKPRTSLKLGQAVESGAEADAADALNRKVKADAAYIGLPAATTSGQAAETALNKANMKKANFDMAVTEGVNPELAAQAQNAQHKEMLDTLGLPPAFRPGVKVPHWLDLGGIQNLPGDVGSKLLTVPGTPNATPVPLGSIPPIKKVVPQGTPTNAVPRTLFKF